jgi:hypothetical protein
MTRYEEYLANADECARMARLSHSESDKTIWRQMANSTEGSFMHRNSAI